MSTGNQLTAWQRWVRQPQKTWLRRALFQVHLWSGIALGLYILMISVTGSVLVYRNELYMAATPALIISKGSGPRLTDGQLAEAAIRSYPGYRVVRIVPGAQSRSGGGYLARPGRGNQEAVIRSSDGNDLGSSAPTGIWLVSKLIALHDDLLAGPTGRKVNGMGALAVLVLAGSGLVIWWPGVKSWRRSLTLHRGVGWKRLTWDLHSMIGFWSLGFVLVIWPQRDLPLLPRGDSGPRRPA